MPIHYSNKKIIIIAGCSVVAYVLLVHSKIGYTVGNFLLNPFGGIVARTGGGMMSWGTNRIIFNDIEKCASRGRQYSYINGECVVNDLRTFELTQDYSSNGKLFKKGDQVKGRVGADANGYSTLLVLDKYGNRPDGVGIEIPVTSLVEINIPV